MELNEIITTISDVLTNVYGLEFHYEVSKEDDVTFESNLMLENLNNALVDMFITISPSGGVFGFYFGNVNKETLCSEDKCLKLLQHINAYNVTAVSRASVNEDNVFTIDMPIIDVGSKDGLEKFIQITLDELINEDNEVILKEIVKYLDK